MPAALHGAWGSYCQWCSGLALTPACPLALVAPREDKQTPGEIRHLVQQLAFSYAANKQVTDSFVSCSAYWDCAAHGNVLHRLVHMRCVHLSSERCARHARAGRQAGAPATHELEGGGGGDGPQDVSGCVSRRRCRSQRPPVKPQPHFPPDLPTLVTLPTAKLRLRRRCVGILNWVVTRSEQHYSQLLGGCEAALSSLVYLTADSDTELEELDPTKAYIIGGMVDHNRCGSSPLGPLKRESSTCDTAMSGPGRVV